jgi:hypothetical protein
MNAVDVTIQHHDDTAAAVPSAIDAAAVDNQPADQH